MQSGLEVPCEYKFFSKDKCEKIARGLLKIASIAVTDISDIDPVTAIKPAFLLQIVSILLKAMQG